MSDLKPCPFCGGEAEILDYRTIFSVECKTCLASVNGDRAPEPESDEHCESIDWEGYKKTAVDRWNNRPQEEKIKREAFEAGFDITREGFNGEHCGYDYQKFENAYIDGKNIDKWGDING